MSPPRPPSPPSGPPRGTNFSRRKLTQPRPPLPAWARTLMRSTNISSTLFHQLFVERPGLLRDCGPAEFFFRAFSSRASELLAKRRIDHELVDSRCQVAREFFRIARLERTRFHLIDRDKKSGFAI